MWRKYAALILVAFLLSSSFLIFTMSTSSIPDFITQLFQNIEKAVFVEREPEYVKLTIQLQEMDLNHSLEYFGNESGTLHPLRYTYVRIGGEVRSTDRYGKASFIIPKGNYSLMIIKSIEGRRRWSSLEQPISLEVGGGVWTTYINVKSDGEVKITFYLFRLEASNMEVYPDIVQGVSRVKMVFKLPYMGEYYIGKPTITYYTPWGQLRIHYEDMEIIGRIYLKDIWSLVSVDYLEKRDGGVNIELIEEVRSFPTYVLPRYTFLPVERIEVEEKWYSQ
ncbi:MAG: hypothetical protein ABDH32_01960 [Candidatus Caldarchaeales archaeon]